MWSYVIQIFQRRAFAFLLASGLALVFELIAFYIIQRALLFLWRLFWTYVHVIKWLVLLTLAAAVGWFVLMDPIEKHPDVLDACLAHVTTLGSKVWHTTVAMVATFKESSPPQIPLRRKKSSTKNV